MTESRKSETPKKNKFRRFTLTVRGDRLRDLKELAEKLNFLGYDVSLTGYYYEKEGYINGMDS